MNTVKEHFDRIAADYDRYKIRSKYYYDNLKKLLKKHIPRNKIVLEIGCGTGDLITFLKPKVGYGIDISPKMIELCKTKYGKMRNIHFSTKDISDFSNTLINYIFMSDVIEHVNDVDKMFKEIASLMREKTIFICTYANPKWEPLLSMAEKLKLKMPEGKHFRWKLEQLENALAKHGMTIIKHDYYLLLPINIFSFSDHINKYFGKYFKKYSFIEYFVAIKQGSN